MHESKDELQWNYVSSIYVVAVERICKFCKNDVENEMHVLTVCPLYDDIRHDLFVKFTAKYEAFIHHIFKIDKLKLILGCEDEIVVLDQ